MRDDLWRRVEEALDARRSPFDDDRLARELAGDSESEAAARRLVARLALLAPARSARPDAPRRATIPALRTALAAACGVAAALLATRAADHGPGGGPEAERRVRVSLAVERIAPSAARAARVSLAPETVLSWTLEGEER